MKLEDIENMQAGREMDALIAEKVMGYQLPFKGRGEFDTFSAEGKPVPRYSTHIEYAWQVVEKLREYKLHLSITQAPDGYQVSFSSPFTPRVHEDVAASVPLAICRAALKAVCQQEEM